MVCSKIIASTFFLAAAASGQTEAPPAAAAPVFYIRISPILNAIDTDQDGILSSAEIAAAPAQLRKLDKNGDGKLTRNEAGIRMDQLPGRGPRPGGERRGEPETPAPPPTADDMTSSLMMFDANHNGQLEKSEVPDRFQGVFERGDTNKDGILSKEELTALAQSSRQMVLPPRPGRGNRFDLAMTALDTDADGELSAAEIDAAPKTLMTLDKNGDGKITNDEVTPAPPKPPAAPPQ